MTHTRTSYTAELSTPREGSNPTQQRAPETAMISAADLLASRHADAAFCLDVVVSEIAIQRTNQGCVTVRNNDRMTFR